jgi:hypothetical protein
MIKILLYENDFSFLNSKHEDNFSLKNMHRGYQLQYFFNEKQGIHFLCKKYNLKRSDEVYIVTSTDKNYVSTCVSGTFFNYCKISRVFTAQTKMIFVIHEFGIICPEIEELQKLANKLSIPLVEDCAHTILSWFNGKIAGSWGDEILYSLPKQIPVKNGGMLLTKKSDQVEYNKIESNFDLEQKVNDFEKYLFYFSEKRKQNYKIFNSKLGNSALKINLEQSTPYFYIMETDIYDLLYKELDNKLIECGRIYVENWFALPTQPLMDENEIEEICTTIKKIIS